MIAVSTAGRSHECLHLGSAFVARGGLFGARFFDPQIPQESKCVALWQSFPRNKAHELLGQGDPSVLFVSKLGKVVSPVLAPWFGHEKAGILESQYDLQTQMGEIARELSQNR